VQIHANCCSLFRYDVHVLSSQRKNELLERVRRNGSIIAAQVAVEWNVSEDTIRRDLRDLASAGHLQRVHGGAVLSSPAAANYSTRTNVANGPKSEVARYAASMIKAGQTVFLDGGTTTAAMCRALPLSLEITVVTHSPTVAVELVDRPAVEVVLIGGTLYRHSLVTVGAIATEYINSLSVDVFFMGVSGIHPVHGLTTGNAEEAAIKRFICQRAADTVVLASSEKLGTALPHRVVAFGQVMAAITNETNARVVGALRRAGLNIVRTNENASVQSVQRAAQ
jgi:DeoR/GlpR family transcriptional regulator of sugar metabolism